VIDHLTAVADGNGRGIGSPGNTREIGESMKQVCAGEDACLLFTSREILCTARVLLYEINSRHHTKV